MGTKKTHDAVYVEKYNDRDGQEKKRYTNMGALMERDDGSLLLKLETIPVGFNGWIALYVPKEKEQSKAPAKSGNARGPQRPAQQEDESDAPF